MYLPQRAKLPYTLKIPTARLEKNPRNEIAILLHGHGPLRRRTTSCPPQQIDAIILTVSFRSREGKCATFGSTFRKPGHATRPNLFSITPNSLCLCPKSLTTSYPNWAKVLSDHPPIPCECFTVRPSWTINLNSDLGGVEIG
uniref:Uncharacterized protein n=1 Tax=Setaria digitata TaxID=48799 RepID=A0A915PZU1_9BILA